MALLARCGRDVAGALKIWDPTAAGEPRTQPKLVLARDNNQWGQAVDGFASTHIIKPMISELPSLIFDEECGSRIVREVGLASHDTHLIRNTRTTAASGCGASRGSSAATSALSPSSSCYVSRRRPWPSATSICVPRTFRCSTFPTAAPHLPPPTTSSHRCHLGFEPRFAFHIVAFVETSQPHPAAHVALFHDIARFCHNLLEVQDASAPPSTTTTADNRQPNSSAT